MISETMINIDKMVHLRNEIRNQRGQYNERPRGRNIKINRSESHITRTRPKIHNRESRVREMGNKASEKQNLSMKEDKEVKPTERKINMKDR